MNEARLPQPATFPRSPELVRQSPSFEVIPNVPTFYQRLAEDITDARNSVKLLFFTLEYDEKTTPIFKAMEKAGARNVPVEIIYDHVGSTLPAMFRTWKEFNRLKKTYPSIHIKKAHQPEESLNPLRRNHKKLAAIDVGTEHAKAYIGSTNLTGRHEEWNDIMVGVQGTLADQIGDVITKTAHGEHRGYHMYQLGDPDKTEIISDSKNTRGVLGRIKQEILQAKERIWIESGYFDNGEVQQALIQAKQRALAEGRQLDVRIVGPDPASNNDFIFRERPLLEKVLPILGPKSFLNPLVQSGIEVYLYGRNQGRINHAKIFIADGVVSLGSFNFTSDLRSGGNAEIALFTTNRSLLQQMEQKLRTDMADSERYPSDSKEKAA